MENNPFGHNKHRHHHGEEEREEQRRDPYITRGGGEEYQRPPHYGRQEGEGYYPRPPPPSGVGYESGSAYPPVQHVAHEVNQGPYPSSGYGRYPGGVTSTVRTVRIFTKAEPNYSLTIRDGNLILAIAKPSDDYQHWIKDEKYSTQVKDEEGFPSFALVNKVTGQAIKHSFGQQHPVRLVPYNPDYLDESILWSESKDLGDGYRCIRMVNNIRLNFDAFHGDKNHGGVHDGTTVVLWEWLKGDNQRWKIVHY